MYIKYWELERRPFDSVPDPSMYFAISPRCNPVSQVEELIRGQSKKLIVLTGKPGTGKTTSLRAVVDGLEAELYQIAFITNPARTFTPLLREIVGQLQHRICPSNTLGHLVRLFHETVDHAAGHGQRVVVVVDDYNATSIPDLASLHSLLTENGQAATSFIFILAGQPKLVNYLTEGTRKELFQNLATCCAISEIDDRDTMRSYILHRLSRSGRCGVSPFTESAIDALWASSGTRTPRALNFACRLCLKKAAEAGLEKIGGDLATAVCMNLQTHPLETLPPHQVPPLCASGRSAIETPSKSVDTAKVRLANQLAAARIQRLDRVLDPFEAWSAAREEILTTLETTKLRRSSI